jgi:hypothetical protein
MTKANEDIVLDIFNIPVSPKSEETEDDYSDSSNSPDESFDSKADAFAKSLGIAGGKASPALPIEKKTFKEVFIKEEEKKMVKEIPIKEKVEVIKEEPKDDILGEIDFDSPSLEAKKEVVPEKVQKTIEKSVENLKNGVVSEPINLDLDLSAEEPKKQEKVAKKEVVEEKKKEVIEEKKDEISDFVASINLDDWNLDCPDPKFSKFYKEKKKVIASVLKGGRLPLDQFTNELIECHVDVTLPIYDLPEIHRKMQAVQKWRDRVKDIQMNCSKQYFKFEVAMRLLQGLLVRYETARSALLREGVFYEHMADIEMYFADLKHVFKSSEYVSKNLDNAFECLSRQLTIAMGGKSVERIMAPPSQEYSQPAQKVEKKLLDEENYDVLPDSNELPKKELPKVSSWDSLDIKEYTKK